MSNHGRHLAAKLPTAIREGLNAWLRQHAYGDIDLAGLWLTEQGHPIKRSSLHRYAVRLRAVDAESGHGAAPVLSVNVKPRHKAVLPSRRCEILAELIRLQDLQTSLIAELASL